VGLFGSVFLLAQFFQVVQGYSPLESAVRTMPWTMAPMVVAPLAGLLVDRIGARTLIVIGQSMLAAGLLWAGLASTTDVPFGSLVVPFVLAGVGMGLTFAPMTTAVLASVRPASHGIASGTTNTLREVGIAMGVAVLASVFASNGGYGSPASFVDGLAPAVVVGAIVVAVGAVLAMWLPSRSPSPVRVAR
jgi:MFS family permease